MGNYDKTVFIDRDGVINKRLDGDYVKSWSEFEFLSKAKEAVRRLSNAVYDVIVVSNQAGINKGAVSASTVEEIHRLMLKKLSDAFLFSIRSQSMKQIIFGWEKMVQEAVVYGLRLFPDTVYLMLHTPFQY